MKFFNDDRKMLNVFFYTVMSFLGYFSFIYDATAGHDFLNDVRTLQWKIAQDDVDVVWIEDNKFPKFSLSIYFKDGALNEKVSGVTKTTLEQLLSGTKQSTQKELNEFFDFYGASVESSVTHEYSVFSVQALTKDIQPIMGKVCELFREASFPASELNSYLKRKRGYLNNLVSSHSALADRAFRALSLESSPLKNPVEGTMVSLKNISSEMLKKRLAELNKTKKVLFLSGPKDTLKMRKILHESCPWSQVYSADKFEMKKPDPQSKIYLVEVPDANQAQIRIGRYVTPSEFKGKYDHLQFLASFLGGGFTSKLVQELRVKRGLTYSASAYISLQKNYGRAGFSTFSKNETAAQTISVIRSVLSDLTSHRITQDEFDHQKQHAIGSFAFHFEKTEALLSHLIHLHHQERQFENFVEYPRHIEKLTSREISRVNMEQFPWEKLTIVVVGDKSLKDSLSRIRPVKVVNYRDFL